MEMMELAGYGIPAALIARWREQQGARLLPLQEQAVRGYDLFGEGNLLVQAPTSSGKTFIGEMAAVDMPQPGTFQVRLVDALAEIEESDLRRGARIDDKPPA